jgi:hypothetical protein
MLDEGDEADRRNELIEPQILIRSANESLIIDKDGLENSNNAAVILEKENDEKMHIFAESQDVFGLLSGAFTEVVKTDTGDTLVKDVTAIDDNLVVKCAAESAPSKSVTFETQGDNILGLLSGQFETPSDLIDDIPPAIKNEVACDTEKKLSNQDIARKTAIANFFNPLAKKMKSVADSMPLPPPPPVVNDDESDYGNEGDSSDAESEETGEPEQAPLFLQQSKSIADLISDDSDLEPEQEEPTSEQILDSESENSDSERNEEENGQKRPLRAILSWNENALKSRGDSKPITTNNVRSKFIEAEAEVEEDEFMNYGGIDGEDNNEKNEYDKSLLNDKNDENINVEAVMDYYQ